MKTVFLRKQNLLEEVYQNKSCKKSVSSETTLVYLTISFQDGGL